MMFLMFLTSLVAATVSVAWSLACVVLRPASGILLWTLSAIRLRRRALRSASQLEDGREYEFDYGGGHRCRRIYFSNPLHAKIDEREAFCLAADDSWTGIGVQCWQKRLPDGTPCPGTGSWMPLDAFFNPRYRRWGVRLVPLKKGASAWQPRDRSSSMFIKVASIVAITFVHIATALVIVGCVASSW